jgi:hypothetical protein
MARIPVEAPPSPVATGPNGEIIVTVTFARELYAPIQYNCCEIGPYSITREVQPGETVEQALEAVNAQLTAFAAKARAQKLAEFRKAYAESR